MIIDFIYLIIGWNTGFSLIIRFGNNFSFFNLFINKSLINCIISLRFEIFDIKVAFFESSSVASCPLINFRFWPRLIIKKVHNHFNLLIDIFKLTSYFLVKSSDFHETHLLFLNKLVFYFLCDFRGDAFWQRHMKLVHFRL